MANEPTTTAPPTAISRPMTIQLVRSVATYSRTTNMPKNSSDVPRSFSKTRMARLSAQMVRIGPRSRPRGRYRPMKRRLASASASRFTIRYPAKKTARTILANSPGWMENGPTLIQILAPKLSVPRPGTRGSSSSTIATTMEMYV